MKITSTQYAKSLYEATKDKSQSEIDEVISNLINVLKKNNQLKLISNVISKFSEIWNKEEGIVEAVVTTRYKLQDTMTKQLEDFLKEKYGAKEIVLNNKIDQKIKGGIIIKVGDELLDASIVRRLKNLKLNFIK